MKIDLKLIIIGVLLIIIFLQKACSPKPISGKNDVVTTTVQIDTVYKEIRDTIIKEVVITKTIPAKIPKEFEPSDDCKELRDQYNTITKAHFETNIYKDTLKIGELGYVSVIDSVYANKFGIRQYDYDIEIPTITKTITVETVKEAPEKRQLYIGPNIMTLDKQIHSFLGGFIYKTKKDQIYQVQAGVDVNGQLVVGGGMYWLIKLK